MNRNRRFSALTLATAIAAVSIAGFAGAADKKTNIQLTLNQDRNGDLLVMVRPQNAKIWRNNPDKPKKVNWWTDNYSAYGELFWELRYDPDKGGGTADYFGEVDIECGQKEIKVQPDKKPDFPEAEWPYSITVYACVDGAKAQKIAAVDPRIIWKD